MAECPLARLDTNTAAGGCSRSPDDPSCTWRECKYYFNQGCFVDATKGNGATWSAAKVLMMASNPAATAVPHSRPKPETAFLDLTMQHYAARNTFSLTIGGDTSMAPNGTQCEHNGSQDPPKDLQSDAAATQSDTKASQIDPEGFSSIFPSIVLQHVPQKKKHSYSLH